MRREDKYMKREGILEKQGKMIMKNKYIWCVILLTATYAACKKPYNPPVISSNNNYLVVEGVINTGNDSTIFKLTRTVNIADAISTAGVDNCEVTVESEAGNSFALLQIGSGKYAIGPMNLDPTKKYRLHIKTPDGKEYASDYTANKPTLPIDSIGFIPEGNNLRLYVNTHDVTNNSRYYRWDFAETWRFHTKFQSNYIVDQDSNKLRQRTSDEQTFYCFTGDVSSNILIGSSAKLGQDVIYQAPLITIPAESEKIELRYSILVRQYTLTKEAYAFWENIKKNTEQLGSIFDAQPSQLMGNIHCISNPAEPVIGYISVTNVQSKRIFIDNSQLPQTWTPVYPFQCSADTALFKNKLGVNDVEVNIIKGGAIALTQIASMRDILGYTFTSIDCADCRIRGRVQPPSFWKEK
ncbi:protein of unknown function [Mucilaginibacter pineti]|uniref:DUF4249 domain-containing protein n=1 Tax=Mucilaginibacter pineti TaxID=1391627 RepID=A0A1G7A9N0_9SPHI|nr:DUF4249 domain-containing protein [Mucilaginibacter pineti]SDE11481.1 protein of unknown function [Mucilaginibacter pineti]